MTASALHSLSLSLTLSVANPHRYSMSFSFDVAFRNRFIRNSHTHTKRKTDGQQTSSATSSLRQHAYTFIVVFP